MPVYSLTALIVVPLAGGIAAWLGGRRNPEAARWIALGAALATVAIALALWVRLGAAAAQAATPILEQRVPWIPRFGVEYHLALDGLNMLFVVLTGVLGCMAVLVSWREIERSVGLHYLCVLATIGGIMGVFLAFDLFLFYFFWELMLLPMYFLIGVWGHEDRIRAAIKFVVFTMASGLFLLVAIIGLYHAQSAAGGQPTTDYATLLGTRVSLDAGFWLFLGFFVAFAVKLPVFPFHTWLPDAHTQAPTAGSILLAGLLLKTGGYGLIRFAVPLFPEAAGSLSGPIAVIGVIGIIYGAILAYGQTDVKRLIAYTSISHMGFVVLGVATWKLVAVQGAVFQMLAHGLATGALFAAMGMLQERTHTRQLDELGGLWAAVPRLAVLTLVLVLASVGVPGMGNFIGELLTLFGSYSSSPGLVSLAVVGIVLGTIAMLGMVQGVFYGPRRIERRIPDAGLRELVVLGTLVLLIVMLGLFPQPALRSAEATLDRLVSGNTVYDPTDPGRLDGQTRTAGRAP